MEETKLGCFWPSKDGGNIALLRAHPGIIVNAALRGYLAAAWNHQKAAHTDTSRNTNTNGTLFAQQHYVKFNENSTQPEVGFHKKKKSILIDQSYNICPKHLATFLNETTASQAWLK